MIATTRRVPNVAELSPFRPIRARHCEGISKRGERHAESSHANGPTKAGIQGCRGCWCTDSALPKTATTADQCQQDGHWHRPTKSAGGSTVIDLLVRSDAYWGGKQPWAKVAEKSDRKDPTRVAALPLTGEVDAIDFARHRRPATTAQRQRLHAQQRAWAGALHRARLGA